MSWLKLDDGFDTHRKILGLKTDARRWTWQRILLYTCRYRSPIVPENIQEAVPKATKKYLEECVNLGLLDVAADGTLKVHDWRIYNGETVAEKVLAYLEQKPDATANDVHKALGGKREVVLSVYAQLRRSGTPSVPDQYPSGTQVVPDQSTPLVPLARARAPVPSPYPSSSSALDVEADDDDEIFRELEQLAPTEEQRPRWRLAAQDEPARVRACLNAALTKSKPRSYFETLLNNGSFPEAERKPDEQIKTIHVKTAWTNFVNGLAWDDGFGEYEILDELRRIRNLHTTSGDIPDSEALEAWRQKRAERYENEQVQA
jgi:hypothetical protein